MVLAPRGGSELHPHLPPPSPPPPFPQLMSQQLPGMLQQERSSSQPFVAPRLCLQSDARAPVLGLQGDARGPGLFCGAGVPFCVSKVVPGVPTGRGQAQHLGCERGDKFCKRKWPGCGSARRGQEGEAMLLPLLRGHPRERRAHRQRTGRELGANWELRPFHAGPAPLRREAGAAREGLPGTGRVTRLGTMSTRSCCR